MATVAFLMHVTETIIVELLDVENVEIAIKIDFLYGLGIEIFRRCGVAAILNPPTVAW